MTRSRSVRCVALAIGAALVVAIAATAASRDLDRSFGGDGVVLTTVGTLNASARAIARQVDGKIVAVGDALVPGSGPSQNGVALVRYLEDGTRDKTFGGGDGIVAEQFDEEGTSGQAVAIQPDGKILVAGHLGCCTARVYVARFLPNGTRDTGFGMAGVEPLPGICCDGADATALAVQADGKILVGGWISNTETQDSFVSRLTPTGRPDGGYGAGGTARLKLGDAELRQSRALGLVLDRGRAVIAGDVLTSDGERDLMLARLDDTGALDDTFGEGGVVQDRAGNDDDYVAEDVALWNGKLVVAGTRGLFFGIQRNYLLARFDADDGELDTTFNGEGTDPGHVFAGAGDGDPRAEALTVNPATGSATVVGSADEDSRRKLLVARYTSEGIRDDASFRSSDGRVGALLLDAGTGGQARGYDVFLDAQGKTVVGGDVLDGGRFKFMLARLGDTPPKPNLRPVARIRGHHIVPRKRWVRFQGLRSFDRDGRIVEYAWRTGDRPFRPLGPVFWHRFGRRGVHVLQLRVRDDKGAVAVATFRVNVRTRP